MAATAIQDEAARRKIPARSQISPTTQTGNNKKCPVCMASCTVYLSNQREMHFPRPTLSKCKPNFSVINKSIKEIIFLYVMLSQVQLNIQYGNT
jgi:hypothetical protein